MHVHIALPNNYHVITKHSNIIESFLITHTKLAGRHANVWMDTIVILIDALIEPRVTMPPITKILDYKVFLSMEEINIAGTKSMMMHKTKGLKNRHDFSFMTRCAPCSLSSFN